MNESARSFKEERKRFPVLHQDLKDRIQAALSLHLKENKRKIIVLDDDPTGVQTVHDIHVYTGWSYDDILNGFQDETSMFFILTNSRAFTESETIAVHRDIGENIAKISQLTAKDYILISRSDSTLRGHYPAEPDTLRDTLERATPGLVFHGEIICPYFEEGGRYTIDDIHYVRSGDVLTPAAQTEFAADKTFGYQSSDLKEWVMEKRGLRCDRSVTFTSISLTDLRKGDVEKIRDQLLSVKDHGVVILNALNQEDMLVFAEAYYQALEAGKRFLFRSAAAIPKAIGGVADQPLLSRQRLLDEDNAHGGLIVVGSHVKKSTRQLDALEKLKGVEFIPFDSHLVTDANQLRDEISRVTQRCSQLLKMGVTVAVYTRRQLLYDKNGGKEQSLKISTAISMALTEIVSGLNVKPAFIIGKGGITASDIGTKGLQVKKALVMGQIAPGIPVWMTGSESRFPNMPYIIFPGNVGEDDTLYQMVRNLIG